MAELLTQTTLRIAEKLKTAAEAAADRESSSFSNYVCRAVAEKLARDAVLLVGEEVRRFAVLVEFDLPESLTGTPLTDTVRSVPTTCPPSSWQCCLRNSQIPTAVPRPKPPLREAFLVSD